MALDPILDSLDSIDEGLRSHYREDNGRYVLDVKPSGGWALENVQGLKQTLSDQQERRKRAQAALDALKGEDGEVPTAEGLRQLKEQLAALQDATPKDQVEQVVAQRIADAKKKLDKDLEKANSISESLKQKLHKVVVEGAAVAAISKAGASDSLKMLLPNVMAQLGIDGLDGEDMPRVFVRGENGAPRLTSGSGMDPMSVDELLAEMKDSPDFARAFPGTGTTGSGSPQPGRAGGASFRLSRTEARDHKKYLAARDAAAKAGQTLQIVEG